MSVPLNQLCELIVDCPHSTAADEGAGYPLIRTPNIGPGYFNLDGVHRVSKSVYDKRNMRAVPQQNDLILAREAPAGNVAIIPKGAHFCLGQRTVLIRPNPERVFPLFLNYYLNAPEQRHKLLRNANGATVSHVNMPIIRNLPIELPSLIEQKKIASILGSYDTLIENNRKQIRLLEEAAQRLYKEWFIDLRFPGYESTPINPETSLPEGWKQGVVKDVIDSIESGKRPRGGIDKSLTEGIPSIGAENVLGIGRYNFSAEKLIPNDFYGSLTKGVVKDRDILIYKDGAYTGRVSLFQDDYPYSECSVNEHVFLVRADDPNDQYWLYFTLNQTDVFNRIQKVAISAAQPGINKADMANIQIMIPPNELRNRYSLQISPFVKEIFVLAKSARNAEQARDRLLPKLMSGEIEV